MQQDEREDRGLDDLLAKVQKEMMANIPSSNPGTRAAKGTAFVIIIASVAV